MTTVECVAKVKRMVDDAFARNLSEQIVVYVPKSIDLFQPHEPTSLLLHERLREIEHVVDVRPTEQDYFYVTWNPMELEPL